MAKALVALMQKESRYILYLLPKLGKKENDHETLIYRHHQILPKSH